MNFWIIFPSYHVKLAKSVFGNFLDPLNNVLFPIFLNPKAIQVKSSSAENWLKVETVFCTKALELGLLGSRNISKSSKVEKQVLREGLRAAEMQAQTTSRTGPNPTRGSFKSL